MGECAIVKLLCFDGQRQKPFSCFDVRAATRAPIDLATETHWETLSVAEGGANKVGSSTLVKVSIEKWMNISNSNPIALTCCSPGMGIPVRLPRGGLGAGAGGAGGPVPQAQLVLAGWPAPGLLQGGIFAVHRLSQSMLSTPPQSKRPAHPAAVHIVP